jgi:xanthine dehydrogenase/oxidase
MKSFATDENPIDIEELTKLKCVNSCKTSCSGQINQIRIRNNDSEWFAPVDLKTLQEWLAASTDVNYKILAANTAKGVYKNEPNYDVYVDIKNVAELHQIAVKAGEVLQVGSLVSLARLIETFEDTAQSEKDGFGHLTHVAAHLGRVASVPIRNVATWAGNLTIKRLHPEFPSDVFVCFETIGASVRVIGPKPG